MLLVTAQTDLLGKNCTLQMSNGCINTDWQGTWLPCSQKFPQNDDQSWAVQNEFMLAKIQISGLFAYWQPDVKVEYTVILEIHNERSCRLKKGKLCINANTISKSRIVLGNFSTRTWTTPSISQQSVISDGPCTNLWDGQYYKWWNFIKTKYSNIKKF